MNLFQQVNLLLSFLKLFQVPEVIRTKYIDYDYILKLINLNIPTCTLEKVFEYISLFDAAIICKQLLKTLKRIRNTYLQFALDFLTTHHHHPTWSPLDYDHIRNALKVFAVLNPTEQDQFYHLIDNPLDIIEVLIMNTKFDTLSAVLQVLPEKKPSLDDANDDDDVDDIDEHDDLSVAKIDALLRKYAEKSLDFRMLLCQPYNTAAVRLLKTVDNNLMQSLDSLNFDFERKPFIMPDETPTKIEWMRNDEVLDCMCCHQITFSMFHRRHHCRRCGRLVCHNCSTKRMLVRLKKILFYFRF